MVMNYDKKAINNNNKIISAAATLAYILMIIANYMANALPLNGIFTADITNKLYPNLFTPAGWTFSIWGLIYFLLLLHTLYSLDIIKAFNPIDDAALLDKVGILFTATSVLNIVWLFAWHYDQMILSEIFMIALWIVLFKIVLTIKKEKYTRLQYFFIKIPFSIYFGWITVATVANTVVMLVSLDFGFFGLDEVTWVRYAIIIGALFAGFLGLKLMDLEYSFIPVWGFMGIIMNHALPSGFGNQYDSIILTLSYTIVGLILVIFIVLGNTKLRGRKARRRLS
jgi:hypothetical protein